VVDVQLHLGDCLEVLKGLPDGSVDAVVTDPPYGVGKASWDDVVPPQAVWREIARILADGGSLVVFSGLKHMPTTMARIGTVLDYQWPFAWYKSNAMQFGKTGFSVLDMALWYGKGKVTAANWRRDVIVCPIVPSKNAFGHPTPKPVDVMLPIVDCVTHEGATVLDPFMGSGTTGVACVQTGRNFIGIEIEPKYYDIARQRIEQTQQQLTLAL
jgi:DNA modification methylase